jgi:hypothetical protein
MLTALLGGLFAMPRTGEAAQRWTHYGLRPLGMGNAFVAVSDDFNALFYNPAGLARLKEWDGELLNLGFTVSSNVQNIIKESQTAFKNADDSSKAALDLIENRMGENTALVIDWTPHLVFQNFGVGVGWSLISGDVSFHRYPSVDLDVASRVIVPISFAKNFLEDRLSVGVTLKARAMAGLDHEFSIEDINKFQSEGNDDLSDFIQSGTGYGADIGLLFTPIKPMEPTLGISITDIGGTSYEKFKLDKEKNVGTPDQQPMSINVGVSAKPWSKNRMHLLTAVDMHSINQPISFSKKLNLGSELALGSILKIQAGLHQGYFTGGVQFDVGLLNLRMVSYSEELGTVAGTTESRRYAVQLKLLI